MKAIRFSFALLVLSMLAACAVDRSSDRQFRSGPEVAAVANLAALAAVNAMDRLG